MGDTAERSCDTPPVQNLHVRMWPMTESYLLSGIYTLGTDRAARAKQQMYGCKPGYPCPTEIEHATRIWSLLGTVQRPPWDFLASLTASV